MDLGTVSGIIFGSVLLLWAITSGGPLDTFINIPSLMITVGGSLCALLITFPLKKVKSVFAATKKAVFSGSLDLVPWYSMLIELATVARRDGILALEEKIDAITDDFLRRGLQMVVDGSPADAVQNIMSMEVENMEERHAIGHDIWKSLGSYGPAFGMIGTL
ncbi:MAG: MotA/TolQ/ExbB proton channel family protein, partial [Victivallales bacterium]|nr:MotA/TolQ/ExbB proton channel family protein [Victivallales bacterium]